MSDFNDRIEAQRSILGIVNSASWKEPLFGLSSKAISRWVMENRIEQESLVRFVKNISERLFFLGAKSQEQVTEEYRALSSEIAEFASQLQAEMQRTFE